MLEVLGSSTKFRWPGASDLWTPGLNCSCMIVIVTTLWNCAVQICVCEHARLQR
jgi:hypothetical protein